MTIQELATAAGVTTRTIRYYVEQGVLPPPDRGRPAEYTENHRRILDLIRRLKEQYLPLEEIRDIVRRLNPDEIEQFLHSTEQRQPAADNLSPAADYIAGVLGRGALRQQLKEQAPEPVAPPAAPAFHAIQAPAPAYMPPATISQMAATAPEPAMVAAESAEQQMDASEESWQRVVLAPGIELQYKSQAAAKQKSAISRLLAAAKKIMAGETADTEELE